jgi:hypothetical protein
MAGIEEAFKKFVKRISSKEEVHPYEPQDEYGDEQTGEKTIPVIQGIAPEYGYQNTMPNFYNQKPYYNYQNIPNQYDQNQPYYQQELAYGGLTKTVPPVSGPDPQGVESLFKRRYS